MACQVEGSPDQIVPGSHHQPAPARLAACGDSAVEGRFVIGDPVACSPVIIQVEDPVGDLRTNDGADDPFRVFPRIVSPTFRGSAASSRKKQYPCEKKDPWPEEQVRNNFV